MSNQKGNQKRNNKASGQHDGHSRSKAPERSRIKGARKPGQLSPARKMALEIGIVAREREAFASELLENRLRDSTMEPSDKAFTRVLALGVAAMRGTLDDIIDRNLNSPNDISVAVRDALRVSTYELIFLDKQQHAAVDQGVELVRSVASRAAGLANAVLRKISACKKDFPFGDPSTDIAAAARLEGFPLWIAQLLKDLYGFDGARTFMNVCNESAPVYLAINSLKADDAATVRALEDTGCKLDPVRAVGEDSFIPGCYLAHNSAVVASGIARHLFSQGSILVSDAAAQQIAFLALPQNLPCSFLEVGSGRGTKTLLLQSDARRIAGCQMELTALDSHGFKGDLLQKRTERYGVRLDDAVHADARDLSKALNLRLFDAAFIDAPCSGLGTLRRHPELRWRLAPDAIADLASIQFAMLCEVARYVKPGGQLTYATCTITNQENSKVVEDFLATKIGESYRILPCGVDDDVAGPYFATPLQSGGSDAHFACVLVRKE